jgi:predicted nucleic acid-binding protein
VIVLDTNVISEFMRREPDAKVVGWLDGLSRQDLWITAISIFELRYGIELHAKGRRRNQLEDNLARVLDAGFNGRILNFDQEAANAAAFISAKQRSSGHPNEIRDILIAGIVVSRRADLATRSVRHFQNLDIRLIDPWTN